jgi:glutathione S-transferase
VGLYASDHPDVPGMRGLHLFHFVVSNCSQRVRTALEEKGLAWESHHVNLLAREHLTADYQRINPNGVVPTLVHDGRVVIESNDIIRYLDEQFPEPPLVAADPAARAAVQALIELASAAQPAIKVLSHELLFRPHRKVTDEDVALFERQHNDASLAVFLRDFMENGAAWQVRLDAAHADMRDRLAILERTLSAGPWLSGDAFGLADVSWIVNVHRLAQAGYDLAACPRLLDWYAVARARPAFDRAVVRYRP